MPDGYPTPMLISVGRAPDGSYIVDVRDGPDTGTYRGTAPSIAVAIGNALTAHIEKFPESHPEPVALDPNAPVESAPGVPAVPVVEAVATHGAQIETLKADHETLANEIDAAADKHMTLADSFQTFKAKVESWMSAKPAPHAPPTETGYGSAAVANTGSAALAAGAVQNSADFARQAAQQNNDQANQSQA